jgi:hypothetical protein
MRSRSSSLSRGGTAESDCPRIATDENEAGRLAIDVSRCRPVQPKRQNVLPVVLIAYSKSGDILGLVLHIPTVIQATYV